ncbi:MAG TPA: HD domain-containing protein [Acidobacteriota bacterium]|jgi:uncharacterized protein|nr:HD domain-containing protein [Acidobacteriota bacterium]HQP73340.1 HD domain-containing protein [Acidobacteriota bacterium]
MPGLLVDLEAVRREARTFFHNARGSHDWEHSERVFRLAWRIAMREGADPNIVLPAALLHDIGRDTEFHAEGRVCHAAVGAALARDVMERIGLELVLSERICHCIASHRYRGEVRPQTIEAEVLFDADKLDSIGAVGIGRAFLFAGEVGARLHDPAVDPEKSQPYTPDDTAYREYLVKLRHIKDRMLTETGREIAEDRHRCMTEFFDRLNKEVQGIL